MKKTTKHPTINHIAVDTTELQAMLCCGRNTATRIGNEANAKIKIGRRTLWNVEKIQQYLNQVSEG